MARIGLSLRRRRDLDFIRFIIILINCVILIHLMWYTIRKTIHHSQHITLDKRTKRKRRLFNLNRIIGESDTMCRNFIRINRRTFSVLLEMLRDVGGLSGTRNMCLEEIVVGFLHTLAHHKKNRMISAHFYRSGETVSRQFHACLMAILKLHVVLLKKPTPIPEDCDDDRWNYFKNCLGALDGTMISVNAPCEDRSKYRTRKGTLAMISVERSVYDEYCKVHTNCKNLYGYSFPHFNVLAEVYGKDYATGKPAEGFVDAIGNMEKSTPLVPITFDSSDDEDTIASGNENQTVESAPPLKKVKRESTSKRKGGKKECESATNSELASLQAFMKDMNVHLSTMASAMKRADEREQQVTEKSEKVLEELLSLEDITPQEALEVAQILTAQPHKLMIFFNCPDNLKGMFVKSLLRGNA